MTRPRRWERGVGVARSLVPEASDLLAVKGGRITIDEYRRRYRDDIAWRKERRAVNLAPGSMLGSHYCGGGFRMVADGDTLCCACSRATAAKGECHRVWAAELLRDAGWRVILDGKELTK
jgi:hypothetical protein